MEWNNIEDNPGLKALCKLMLNSFWGKFGQKDNMTNTEFITSVQKYFEVFQTESLQVHDIFAVSDECMMVTTSQKEEYHEGGPNVNIAVAAFTTSYARLKLLDMMEKLGDRLLYYDTDSVIFVQRPGDWLPETGNVLGDWDNQLEKGESHIVRFVSCGPKVYSYETDTGRIELKVKGFSQNGYTENILKWDQVTEQLTQSGQALDFNQLKHLLECSGETVQVIYPEHITRNGKTQKIDTVQLAKRLRLVYDKRVLLNDFRTIPFGTKY